MYTVKHNGNNKKNIAVGEGQKDLKAHHRVGEVTYRGELSKFPPKFCLLFLCHPKPLGKSQERLFELKRDKKLPKGHIGTHIASFLVVHSIHMIK